MDRLQNIETFVKVAQTQSFAEAARQLRVAKSVVTTRVKQLEDFLGGPLFHRSTRAVRLSEMGQAFLNDCADLVGRANDIVEQMREVRSSPSGVLRIQAVPGIVLGHMADFLLRFQNLYPEIVLDIQVIDEIIDPVKEGFDCVLQIFPPKSDELIARELFPVRRVFCATPAYLKKFGTPKNPVDLLKHRLGLYSGYPTRDRWTFHRHDKKVGKALNEPVVVDLKPALRSNSVHLLRDYGLAEAGVVCLPTFVASEPVLNKSLQIVLSDFRLSNLMMSAVYPKTLRGNYKLKLFVESLSDAFSGVPPWDIPLQEKLYI
jgi:DNA-binding transcriptional LysR family regulator